MIQDNFKRTVLKIKYKNMSLNLLVILLLSSFFMPFFRVEAYAISPYTPGTLGICTIANPTYDPSNSNDSPHPSEYNRVYFGWIPENPKARVYNDPFNGPSDPELINPYGDLSNIPLYWRVLNTQSNDCREYKKEALFMLMEYSLPNGISWDNRSSSRQRWSIEVEENNDNNDDDYNTIMSTESENGEKTDSSIRLFLQGSSCNASYDGINPGQVDPDDPTKVLPGKYGFYDDCFSSAEQRAILSTQNNERDNWYNSGLSPEFDKADMPNFHTSKDGNNFRIVGDTSDASTACAYGCGLKGDTIFLLSAKEILNKEYGFDNSYGQEILSNDEYIYATIFDTNRIVRNLSYSSGSNNLWWLRSASFSSSGIAMVFNGALSVNSSISSDCHVRCALNIPLHSILMVSDASSEGMSPSITGNNIVAQFSPINTTSQFINNSPNPLYLKRTKFTYGTSEFSTQPLPESDPVVISPNPTVSPTPGFYGYGDGAKLTIVDDSMQFSLTNPSPNSTVNVYSGNKITISYSGAKNTYGTENVTGYISAIIKPGEYDSKPLYYARLKTVDTPGDGEVCIKVPPLDDGYYNLIIYNEIERGPYKTNYAKPEILTIYVSNIVDKTAPIINNAYRNASNTTFKFTATDDTELDRVVTSSGYNQSLFGNIITTNINTNEAQTSIDVYDSADNLTRKYIDDMILDDTPPQVVNITYDDGTYTLTISDNESGIWKITNGDGTRTYHDCSTIVNHIVLPDPNISFEPKSL